MSRFVSTYECVHCGRDFWGLPAYWCKLGDVVIRLCAKCERWRKGEPD